MEKTKELQYIKHRDIDSKKWNRCVKNAPNSKVYALSWYLDIVAGNWDALVWGNYEFVMPLPVRSKFGIKYVYQPTYCQQLGIFPSPTLKIQKEFALQLRNKFRLISYQINSDNNVEAFDGFSTNQKANFELPLTAGYQDICNDFSKHAKRNIRTTDTNKVKVVKGLLHTDYIQEKKQATKITIKEATYQILIRLMANSISSGKGVVYTAYSSNNSLCAAAFIIFDKNRAYYLNAFSTDEGRENRAMYAIIEHILKEYSGSGIIIDFEGSVIEGIARFYKGFGATPKKYSYIYSNRLPVIRWFMK